MDQKKEIRVHVLAARRAQIDKDELSRRIVARFLSLPEYQSAETVLWYVDVRAEVRTRHDLPAALESGKRIVVPWCKPADELELFHLESMHELERGRYEILEPRAELRTQSSKCVTPEELDLVMVPGVAFDRRGGRLGYGRGYFDKLLAQLRPDAPLVGLAFECQMVDEIPMDAHDVFMDKAITERRVYDGPRRRSANHRAAEEGPSVSPHI